MERIARPFAIGFLVIGLLLAPISIFSDQASAYVSHPPISINGDSNFTGENGVASGNGSLSDPYIIEGWDIYVVAVDEFDYQPPGISITNTDAHFVIRNCSIHATYWDDFPINDCIYLSGVSNGTVSDNELNGFGDQVYLCQSDYCEIRNNTGSGTLCEMYQSNHNLVERNYVVCAQMGGPAVFIRSNSENNTVRSNLLGPIGCHNAIAVSSANRNDIINNTCSIWLSQSSGCTIVGNTIDSNVDLCGPDNSGYGLQIISSSNRNLVESNLIKNNTLYGVYIQSSSNNTIWNNTFSRNNGATEFYDPSHVQAFDDGTNNHWNDTEGFGNFWEDWQGRDSDFDGVQDIAYNITHNNLTYSSDKNLVPTAKHFSDNTSQTITSLYNQDSNYYMVFPSRNLAVMSFNTTPILSPTLTGAILYCRIATTPDYSGNSSIMFAIGGGTPATTGKTPVANKTTTLSSNLFSLGVNTVSSILNLRIYFYHDGGLGSAQFDTLYLRTSCTVPIFNDPKDSFPRAFLPAVTITSPTSISTMSTGWYMIYLRGTAVDDAKIVSVTWSNSLGGSGTAYMTPQYGGPNVDWQSRGNVMLYDGANVITVTALDNDGNIATDVLTVTYNSAPSVLINAPTINPTMTTNWHMIYLRGNASDDYRVNSVAWTNSLGGSGTMYLNPQYGGANITWQSRGNVNLLHGINVIIVTAYDNTGKSATDTLTVNYTGP